MNKLTIFTIGALSWGFTRWIKSVGDPSLHRIALLASETIFLCSAGTLIWMCREEGPTSSQDFQLQDSLHRAAGVIDQTFGARFTQSLLQTNYLMERLTISDESESRRTPTLYQCSNEQIFLGSNTILPIGIGGFGVIRKVVSLTASPATIAAKKALRIGREAEEQELAWARKSFHREIEALTQFGGRRGIVSLLGYTVWRENPILFLELFERNLSQLFEERHLLSLDQTKNLMLQLLDGLQTIAQYGVCMGTSLLAISCSRELILRSPRRRK